LPFNNHPKFVADASTQACTSVTVGADDHDVELKNRWTHVASFEAEDALLPPNDAELPSPQSAVSLWTLMV